MGEPIRVLHVITGLSSGGAESFIMNMYRNIDHDKVQFDFLLRSNDNRFADELKDNGSRVYYTASFPKHAVKNALEVKRFFQLHAYDIVHVHGNALLYMTALEEAKRVGVPCRIMHSHNSSMANLKALPIHNFNKKRIHSLATDCFACSDEAGKWMFDSDYRVIHNAVDTQKFRFDEKARNELRAEWSIPKDALVIGHIGRFWNQKNHPFLIKVFKKVQEVNPDAYLVLIGDGGNKTDIEKMVSDLNLDNRVVFAGVRADVHKALSAFDVFAFPSIYEGLSVVVMESQANGLPVICSEATSTEALFSEASVQISLEKGVEVWRDAILAAAGKRYDAESAIIAAGYDICHEAKKLQDFYCCVNKRADL